MHNIVYAVAGHLAGLGGVILAVLLGMTHPGLLLVVYVLIGLVGFGLCVLYVLTLPATKESHDSVRSKFIR